MEDFDFIPDPNGPLLAQGVPLTTSAVADGWLAVDVNYPKVRDIPADLLAQRGSDRWVKLSKSESIIGAVGSEPPEVRLAVYPTWDNRRRRLVTGVDCR